MEQIAKKPNPWAVCEKNVGKKENPEKFERCVHDVKKKQAATALPIRKYASGWFNSPVLPGQMFKSQEELVKTLKKAAPVDEQDSMLPLRPMAKPKECRQCGKKIEEGEWNQGSGRCRSCHETSLSAAEKATGVE